MSFRKVIISIFSNFFPKFLKKPKITHVISLFIIQSRGDLPDDPLSGSDPLIFFSFRFALVAVRLTVHVSLPCQGI